MRIIENNLMKNILRRERILGILLALVVVILPEILGFRLSTNLGILWFQFTPIIISQIIVLGLRVLSFCIGILLMIKLLAPYIKYSLWVENSGRVFLFDEVASVEKSISRRQVLGVIVSSFLVGFGLYGFIILSVLLLRLILKGY